MFIQHTSGRIRPVALVAQISDPHRSVDHAVRSKYLVQFELHPIWAKNGAEIYKEVCRHGR